MLWDTRLMAMTPKFLDETERLDQILDQGGRSPENLGIDEQWDLDVVPVSKSDSPKACTISGVTSTWEGAALNVVLHKSFHLQGQAFCPVQDTTTRRSKRRSMIDHA